MVLNPVSNFLGFTISPSNPQASINLRESSRGISRQSKHRGILRVPVLLKGSLQGFEDFAVGILRVPALLKGSVQRFEVFVLGICFGGIWCLGRLLWQASA